MNKVIKVEDFFHELKNENKNLKEYVNRRAIEFAKMHVEAALKEASEKVILLIDNESIGDDYDSEDGFIQIDKMKILNAYPLTLIK
jgi:hypothetical protein